MKRALFTIRSAQALLVALLVLVFSASCTKKDHDCAQPKPTTTNTSTTRGADFNTNARNIGMTEGDAGATFRGGEMGNGEGQGGGISDDGDDQSDNERSHRKPRPN